MRDRSGQPAGARAGPWLGAGLRRPLGWTWADVRSDIVAGVVLSALLIPVGMGYAEVAGLPPVTGLHATIAGLVAYALLGPSRVLVLGPDSSLAPMIAAAVGVAAVADPDRAVALAGLLSLLVGAWLVLGALARLSRLTDLLSTPIRIGYLNGLAIVVLVDQVPALLGFDVDEASLGAAAGGVVRGLRDGAVVGEAAVLGVGALVLILVVRTWFTRVPGLLLALVGAGLAVWWLGLDVPVVGALPRGLPAPALGGLGLGDVVDLIPAAGAIALVALADTAALSRAMADEVGEVADDRREMVGLGAANLACGAVGGFPVSGSFSRTPAALESGARTQLAGLVGAAVVAGLVVAAPGLTRHVPSAVLAAVVIAAVTRLVDLPGVVRLASVSWTELGLCVAATLGVALVGVIEGIGIAVLLSLVAFVAKAWNPHTAQLGRVEDRKGYHDLARHPQGNQVPGLLILRFDAALFFANGPAFSRFVRTSVTTADQPVRWVAIAAEPITDLDTTAAEELVRLDDELGSAGIRLVFAEMKGPVKDRLARYGLGERFTGRHYPTIGTTVTAYLAATGIDYQDWTDQPG
jgi:high affinity sulfate transporter 1